MSDISGTIEEQVFLFCFVLFFFLHVRLFGFVTLSGVEAECDVCIVYTLAMHRPVSGTLSDQVNTGLRESKE